MRTLFFSLLTLLITATGVHAQRLVIGEKAPEVRIAQWLEGGTPSMTGKAYLVDFFLSSNSQCVANLLKLNSLQNNHKGKLNVILISREEPGKVQPFIQGKGYSFYIGIDDESKTFNGYGVRFVPFAALVDSRGRLVWTGNIASLTDDIINKAL